MPYRAIEDPAQLRRLLQATMLLGSELELPLLLAHVVEEARSMTGARYGALGVLDRDRSGLAEFVTSGLSSEDEDRLGDRPEGRGLLGLLITEPRPLRVANIAEHSQRFGFPPGHPPMTSFLGVPVQSKGEIYGNLYLTDKVGWAEFTQDDERLVEALAVVAGVAIETARLHQRVTKAALFEERDRIARDLHDSVIQRLFGTGLALHGVLSGSADEWVKDRVRTATAELDAVVQEIRSSIFQLGTEPENAGPALRSRLVAAVREVEDAAQATVRVSLDGPIDTVASDELAEHVLAAVREVLVELSRHAGDREVGLGLSTDGKTLDLVLEGQEEILLASTGEDGLGLSSLHRKAAALGGTVEVSPLPESRARLLWQVPVTS